MAQEKSQKSRGGGNYPEETKEDTEMGEIKPKKTRDGAPVPRSMRNGHFIGLGRLDEDEEEGRVSYTDSKGTLGEAAQVSRKGMEECFVFRKGTEPIYLNGRFIGFMYENYFGREAVEKCIHNRRLFLASVKRHFDGNLVKLTSNEDTVRVFSRSFLPPWPLVENKAKDIIESLSTKRKLIADILLKRNKQRPGAFIDFKIHGLHHSKDKDWHGKFLSRFRGNITLRSDCRACKKALLFKRARERDLLRILPCTEVCKKHLIPFSFIDLSVVSWPKIVGSPFYSELMGFVLCFFIQVPSQDELSPIRPANQSIDKLIKRNRIASFADTGNRKPINFRNPKEKKEHRTVSFSTAAGTFLGAHDPAIAYLQLPKKENLREENQKIDDVLETGLSDSILSRYFLSFTEIAESLPSIFKGTLAKKTSCKQLIKLRNILNFLSILFMMFPEEFIKFINIEMYFDKFMFPLRSAIHSLHEEAVKQLAEAIHYAFSFLGLANEYQASRSSARRNLSETKSILMGDFFSEVQESTMDEFCKEFTEGSIEECEIAVANSVLECFSLPTSMQEIQKQSINPKGSFVSSFSCDAMPENCLNKVTGVYELWKNLFTMILIRQANHGLLFLIKLGMTASTKRNLFLVSLIREVFGMPRFQKLTGNVSCLTKEQKRHFGEILQFKEKENKRIWCVPRALAPFRENFEIPDVMAEVKHIEELSESKKPQWEVNQKLFKAIYPLFQLQFYPFVTNKSEGTIFERAKERLTCIIGSSRFMPHLEAYVSQL